MMGRQKTGCDNDKRRSRFLASDHGGGIHRNKSFCDSRAQDLCPEEGSLGLLDNLLVHRLRGVVHDHGALLVVDLGVNPGIADEVDNPLLTLVLAQTKAGREVPR